MEQNGESPWYLKTDWHEIVRNRVNLVKNSGKYYGINEQDWEDCFSHVIFQIYRNRAKFDSSRAGYKTYVYISIPGLMNWFLWKKFSKKNKRFNKSYEICSWLQENDGAKYSELALTDKGFNFDYEENFIKLLDSREKQFLGLRYKNTEMKKIARKMKLCYNTVAGCRASIQKKYKDYLNYKT